MQDTKQVIHVTTNSEEPCRVCGWREQGWSFESMVNHLLREHGCTLLHVGQQTSHAREGLWHSTVAVVGTK